MNWVNLLFSSYRFLSKQKIINDKEKIFPWCHNHLDIICCPAWSPLKLEPGSKSTLFSIDLTISDPRDQGWLYAGLISLTPGPEISHLPCGGLRSHYHSGGHWWHTGGDGWPGLCSGGDTGGMATAVSTAATVQSQHNTIWDTGPGRHKRRAAARAAEKINESWGGRGSAMVAGVARRALCGPCHRSLSFARGKAAYSAQKLIFPSFFFSLTEDVGCQRNTIKIFIHKLKVDIF